jgi:hypothetical protein
VHGFFRKELQPGKRQICREGWQEIEAGELICNRSCQSIAFNQQWITGQSRWRCNMHFPRIPLAVVSAAVLLPSVAFFPHRMMGQAAFQTLVNLPRILHMCAGAHCQTLTWNDGHYDGTLEGQTEVTTTFGVVRWDREAVDFTGIVSKPDPLGNYVTGIFTGHVSPAGNSVDDLTDTWRAGPSTGSAHVRLIWNPSDLAGAAAARSRDRLPAFFRLCGGPCVGLTRNGGQYAGRDENTGAQVATYTVASLSPELAYINLTMVGGQRGIVTGRVVGHTLVDGKLTWLNFFNGDTVRVRAAWDEDVASIQQGPIIRIPTQQTYTAGVQQPQINPWMLLLGVGAVAAIVEGDGSSAVKRDACGNEISKFHTNPACMSAGRAAQLNHQQ